MVYDSRDIYMVAANLARLRGPIKTVLTQIGEQIKKTVREVRLTVSWQNGRSTESFDVVTHLVVTTPEEM